MKDTGSIHPSLLAASSKATLNTMTRHRSSTTRYLVDMAAPDGPDMELGIVALAMC
jgi:hypothetical protein